MKGGVIGMSKEMLKEADEWLSSMNKLLSEKTDEGDRAYMQKRINLFNWLIERAKQAEELEKLIDKADGHAVRNGKTIYCFSIMRLTDEIAELKHDKEHLELIKERQEQEYRILHGQNNRYREALEKLQGIISDRKYIEDIIIESRLVILEALEGEE